MDILYDRENENRILGSLPEQGRDKAQSWEWYFRLRYFWRHKVSWSWKYRPPGPIRESRKSIKKVIAASFFPVGSIHPDAGRAGRARSQQAAPSTAEPLCEKII